MLFDTCFISSESGTKIGGRMILVDCPRRTVNCVICGAILAPLVFVLYFKLLYFRDLWRRILNRIELLLYWNILTFAYIFMYYHHVVVIIYVSLLFNLENVGNLCCNKQWFIPKTEISVISIHYWIYLFSLCWSNEKITTHITFYIT